jgi:hypothetical protein
MVAASASKLRVRLRVLRKPEGGGRIVRVITHGGPSMVEYPVRSPAFIDPTEPAL